MKSESISAEKKRFCKSLTIITDTREQKNSHILSAFDSMGVRHEVRKLHFGDYSFICELIKSHSGKCKPTGAKSQMLVFAQTAH